MYNSKQDINSKRHIIEKLLALDKKLYEKGCRKTVKFIIFGGSAFLLLKEHRVTGDIDILLLEKISAREIAIFDEFGINNRMQGVANIPPIEEIIKRMQKMKINFQCLEVFIPHPHDLVFTKLLGRCDSRDIKDVVESGILDDLNLDRLREEYNDYANFTLNPQHCPDIDDIIDQYKQFKNK